MDLALRTLERQSRLNPDYQDRVNTAYRRAGNGPYSQRSIWIARCIMEMDKSEGVERPRNIVLAYLTCKGHVFKGIEDFRNSVNSTYQLVEWVNGPEYHAPGAIGNVESAIGQGALWFGNRGNRRSKHNTMGQLANRILTWARRRLRYTPGNV